MIYKERIKDLTDQMREEWINMGASKSEFAFQRFNKTLTIISKSL